MSSETTNPLIQSLRIPGQTFRVPSRGLFYTNGELDETVKNGEVEVYPMTAIDEIVISTPDKLLSGKAIPEVFTRCIPQVLKPELLLSKDVDYLMACLRLVTFGSTIDMSYNHNCSDESSMHTYTVSIEELMQRSIQMDPTATDKDYKLVLPGGQRVFLRPMTYEDVVKVFQLTAVNKDTFTEQEASDLVVTTLSSIIDSVDDVKDRTLIKEWLLKIPLQWKKLIEQKAQDVTKWGVDFTVHEICKDCGKPIEISVSPNPVNFFM